MLHFEICFRPTMAYYRNHAIDRMFHRIPFEIPKYNRLKPNVIQSAVVVCG